MRAVPIAISFVIPVLNDAARLADCLASIAANDRDAVDVIVVDNGSTDESADVARRAGVQVLTLAGLPVAAVRNAGARMASGDVLAFVDADHHIGPAWVAAARSTLAEPAVGAAGAPYLTEGATWVQRAYDGLRSRSPVRRPATWLGSGNLAVRRRAFLDVNGFDETLETCEDVDLCRRLRAAGWTIMDEPRLVSVHRGDPRTLRAVFMGELWRGRDNLVVSFRRPIDLRGVVSAVVPAAILAALVAIGLGAAFGETRLWTLAGGIIAAVAFARAGQLCANRRRWQPLAIAEALPVAFLYEMGRSLALVARAGHRSRRAGDTARVRTTPK